MQVTGLLAPGAGIAVLVAVWFLPLHELLPGPFSVHMTMHMGVVALAAPLLAMGVAGRAIDPVHRAPWLFPPVLAAMVELVVVWAWHTPALHHAARQFTSVLAIEQASFLLVALWLWLSALGGGPAQRADRGGAGIVAMLLTSMHMTLLGALLALPPRTLYGSAGHGPGQPAGLADQHLGGAIMLAAGALSYLVGGLVLAAELLRRRAQHSRGALNALPVPRAQVTNS
jgi:putative membrane protein